MKRRYVILALTFGSVTIAGGSTAVLRLHKTPRRNPYLTDEHLRAIAQPLGQTLRVLFIGNSMVMNHDVPSLVVKEAAKDGTTLTTATAAAHGIRLVETVRVDALMDMLKQQHWDAVVVQDFTKTPLRVTDRLGSAYAIGRIQRAMPTTPVVLYPPFPARRGHSVYRNAGTLTVTPRDPADYAERTMRHYADIADRHGLHVAPVPARWLSEGRPDFYARDGHHPSPAGAQFIADVLWSTLKDVLL